MSFSPIRAVIYDIGNVLYHWDIRNLYAKLIDDKDRLDWFVSHVVTPEWHFQHDQGRALAPMVAELIEQWPQERELIEAYVPRWLDTIPGPVAGALETVRELHDRGVPLFAISNFGVEFWDMFRPTEPIFDLFEDIVISGAEKLMKPDPAIYRLALTRFGLSAHEAIFVDDRIDNVAAARGLGIAAHHFRDTAIWRSALTELDLL
jgi:2-haloacid dehalogenase